MKSPKAPKPTAEETAMVRRQQMELDEETAKTEKRLKAVSRGTLGTKSLLASAKTSKAKSPAKAASVSNAGSRFTGYNARIGLTRNR